MSDNQHSYLDSPHYSQAKDPNGVPPKPSLSLTSVSYVHNEPDSEDELTDSSNAPGLFDIHKQYEDLKSSSFDLRKRQSEKERVYEHRGLTGLRNIGNTCFMNSILQCLSNTELLLDYVLISKKFETELNTTSSPMKGALILSYAKLVEDLWGERRTRADADTSDLKDKIQKFCPTFRGARQHDSQELLRFLLEGLHYDLNRYETKPKLLPLEINESIPDKEKSQISWEYAHKLESSRISDIFNGQLKSTLTCLECKTRSVTFDIFWDLSIPIPVVKTAVRLEDCLELFTSEETLVGNNKPYCPTCKSRKKHSKRFTIEKFPQVLVIHLKRFTINTDERVKLHTIVKFPLRGLDMGAYAENARENLSYNLYGISSHSGTTHFGHYIAFCRHPYSLKWHCYDDSHVTEVSNDGVSQVQAYVLFYEMSMASKCVASK